MANNHKSFRRVLQEPNNQSFGRYSKGNRPSIGPFKGGLIIGANNFRRFFRRFLQDPNSQSFDLRSKGKRPRIGPFKGSLTAVANNQNSSGEFFRGVLQETFYSARISPGGSSQGCCV